MYKPVLANTANVSSSSPLGAENWHFSRIGDMVTIFIGVQITPTAGSAATTLTFDLPIPCTNTPAGHGCVACDTVNRSGGVTAASATTGTIDHYSAGTSAYNFRGSFSYIIN
jgi:hypothetical protein